MNIDTDTFIFVIGVPRSGTTWVFDMITAHKNVASMNGSNTFLQNYVFPLEDKYARERQLFANRGFTRGLPSKLSQAEFEEFLGEVIQLFYSRVPGNRFYVEKATDLTSELHKIRKYIPNSKFIHVIRDGRNCTISRIKNRKSYGKPFGIENIHEGAITWKKQILEARSNSANFSSDVLEVKYEDLVKDPEHYLRQIFEHVGLETDSQTIVDIVRQNHYNTKPVSNPTSPVISSTGEAVQPYKTEMTIEELAYFEYFAGDLLESLGYSNTQLLANKRMRIYIKHVKVPRQFLNTEFQIVQREMANMVRRILKIVRRIFTRVSPGKAT